MKITINNKTYEVIKNEKDAIDEEVLKEAITEYFENFDFVCFLPEIKFAGIELTYL